MNIYSGPSRFLINTIQTIELFMSWYGKSFLESSVGSVIRRICIERVSIEVDPSKIPMPTRDPEKNVETLVQWCRELWDSIYRVTSECPPEMRRLFEHIRKQVEKRCLETNTLADDGSQSDLPWQAVSAFVFLRFIVPAILHPHLFGLVPGKLFLHPSSLTMTLPVPVISGLPEASVQRTLTLVAKVLQSSANLNSVRPRSHIDFPIKFALTLWHPHVLLISRFGRPSHLRLPPCSNPCKRNSSCEVFENSWSAVGRR